MLRWLRYAATFAVGVARRFYLNAPKGRYEMILFTYIKMLVAEVFFREAAKVATGSSAPAPDDPPGRAARRH